MLVRTRGSRRGSGAVHIGGEKPRVLGTLEVKGSGTVGAGAD